MTRSLLLLSLLALSGTAAADGVCGSDTVILGCATTLPGAPQAICGKVDATDETLYAAGAEAATLQRSFLGFAGNTGGYAFTVDRNGQRTILYAIEGTEGFRDNGVIVTDAQGQVTAKQACAPGSFVETQDDALIKAGLALPKDPEVDVHGLPQAPATPTP